MFSIENFKDKSSQLCNYTYMNKNVNVKEEFPKRLKELIKSNNLTNAKLSKLTGIPKNTISNWLNGNRTIQIDNLSLLADFFNVSERYLLGKED